MKSLRIKKDYAKLISRKDRIKETAYFLIQRGDFENKKISIKDIEITGNNNIIVKVYLTGENDININDCANFHREFMLLLTVEELWDDQIHLEVSSLGISD